MRVIAGNGQNARRISRQNFSALRDDHLSFDPSVADEQTVGGHAQSIRRGIRVGADADRAAGKDNLPLARDIDHSGHEHEPAVPHRQRRRSTLAKPQTVRKPADVERESRYRPQRSCVGNRDVSERIGRGGDARISRH